jgi:hypothetical protein
MKYYPALCAALGFSILALLGLRWEICEVDLGAAAHAATVPVGPWELPEDPPAHPDCYAPMVESATIGLCINGWAIISDHPIYLMSFEELAHSRAVLFYCEEPAHPIVGHVRRQADMWVKDGQIAVDCGGADYAIVFP